MHKSHKARDLTIVILCYIVAIIGGYFSSIWIKDNIYLQLFFADVIATIIIWAISLFIKNTSLYDWYWSLIPLILAVFVFIKYQAYTNVFSCILLGAISFYSLRLDINWVYTFTDFSYEDWRYKMFRETKPAPLFHLVNFVGFMMMPTVFVYLGTLPVLVLLVTNVTNAWSIFGIALICIGTLLELIADNDVHAFLRETKEKITCQRGLWNYSRHPNYLGENLIWLGCFVSMIVVRPDLWYLGVGFLLILLLFLFISIPMMEKRQINRRSDYALYKKTTSMFLILPKRKNIKN